MDARMPASAGLPAGLPGTGPPAVPPAQTSINPSVSRHEHRVADSLEHETGLLSETAGGSMHTAHGQGALSPWRSGSADRGPSPQLHLILAAEISSKGPKCPPRMYR